MTRQSSSSSLSTLSRNCLLCLFVACSLPLLAGGQEAVAAAASKDNTANMDVFDLLDENHDGRMDRNEFNRAVNQFQTFLRHHPNDENSSGGGWFFGRASRTVHGDTPKKDLSFWSGFTSAVAMILATEIGDKTFFIAAVLSMKQDRRCIFGGAIAALIVMTVLSTLMGLLLPQFLDRKYTHLLAGALFGYFGVKLVYDSRGMASNKVSEELDEVEEELLMAQNKKKLGGNGSSSGNLDDSYASDNNTEDETAASSKVDLENPMRNRNGFSPNGTTAAASAPPAVSKPKKHRKKHRSHKSPWHAILLQSFMLTFVAEWGDRSQIATIALAAAKNPYGVTVGGCVGHSMCTGLAVLGGRMLAARISEKTVSQWGGILFLIFGIHSLFFES